MISSSNPEFRVLVVGAGTAGERHAKAQRDRGSITTLFDIDPIKTAQKASALGIKSSSNLHEAIEESNLVYICTPDSTHIDIASEAIKRGKDVFSEKPLTTNLKDALTLQELVHRNGTRFIVGHYYRLNPTIMAAKQALLEGKVGKLVSLYSTYLHNIESVMVSTPWRREQNFLYGGGVHPLDLVCWIADEPVESVEAKTGIKTSSIYLPDEDYRINARFVSGLQAHVWLNAVVEHPAYKHGTDLVLWGDRGSIQTHNRAVDVNVFSSGQLKQVAAPMGEWPVDAVARIINGFLTGTRADHDPLPNIDDAIPLMRVLDAAQRSIDLEKTVKLQLH